MNQRSKLHWQCRRGMKELDIVLLRYLERDYDRASEQERRVFTELLELQDPQLFSYIMGRETPPDAVVADVIRKISSFKP